MKLAILRDGKEIMKAENEKEAYLVFREEFIPGDAILFSADPGFYTLQLDHVLGRSTLYKGEGDYVLSIPFGKKHDCYQEYAFRGDKIMLWARKAYEWEIGYRNLSLNPYDAHENASLFPHSRANIETRGESVFASRNAFDGILASDDHGRWPWASWGINRDPNAELYLDFGRPVTIDRLVFYTRADFPHDAWWTEAEIAYSDGTSGKYELGKVDGPQERIISERTITSLTLRNLIKADDPSPFPALIQLEVYGRES